MNQRMTRIAKLSEEYSLPAQRLGGRGVFTVDDLWECIGNEVDKGIAKVVQTTPVDKDVLLALLIADALGDPKRSYKPKPLGLWFGLRPVWNLLKRLGTALRGLWGSRGEIWAKVREYRYGVDLFWLVPKWLWLRAQEQWRNRHQHWPDLILFGLPLLIIGLGVRARLLDQRVVQRVVVKPGVTLPAFAAIDTQKLITQPILNQSGTFASIDDLKLRYPLRDLAAGALLKEEQLVPESVSNNFTGRRLLSLPTKNQLSASVQSMDLIKLMLASREKEKPGVVIDDVLLLEVKKYGDATYVVVALTEPAVKSIEPLLGVSDVFVLQTLH